MTFRLRHLLLILLVATALLITVAWVARDPLSRNVLHPWLEERIGQALDGKVSLAKLSLSWGQVDLIGIRFARPDVEASAANLKILFTIDGLLQRRIEKIDVQQPEVLLRIDPTKERDGSPGLTLPSHIPLYIKSWSLQDGELKIDFRQRSYVVQEFAATGSFGEAMHYAASAKIGKGDGVNISLAGKGRWQNGLEVTLEELVWDKSSLLQEAVTIRPGASNDLAIEIAFQHFSESDAAKLLQAFDQPLPWPEELKWQVKVPVVSLRLADEELTLTLQTGPGELLLSGRQWPWQSIGVALEQVNSTWQIDSRLDLMAAGRIDVQGTWENDLFTGHFGITAPHPASLAGAYGFVLPEQLAQSRDLSISARTLAGADRSTVTNGRFSFDWKETGNLSGGFHGDWQSQSAKATLEDIKLTSKRGTVPLATASLDITGDPATSTWQGKWQILCDDLNALMSESGLTAGEQIPNLRTGRLTGRLKIQDKQLLLPDMQLSGSLDGQGVAGKLQARLALDLNDPATPLLGIQDLSLKDIEYSNNEGTLVAVGGQLSFKGQFRLAEESIALDLGGQASLDEALAGSWYGNLKGLPLAFAVRGHWLHKEKSLQLERADIDLAGLANSELVGRLSARTADVNGRLALPQLSGRFLETLHRLGGELAPGLKKVGLAGALKVQARIVWQEHGWRLEADLQPERLAAEFYQSLTLSGLNGNLPMVLQSGTLPETVATQHTGHLSWDEMSAPLIPTASGKMEFLAGVNSWRTTRPLEIVVAGGRAHLSTLRLSWQDFIPQGEAALSITDVDLYEVSRAFGWPELDGLLSASLDGIRFSEEEITSSGEASAQAFGGTLRLQNLKVIKPLSRYPTYHADIDFKDIDLHALTHTLAFGEINGVASGHVHKLRLFDGIPSAFEASFETAESGNRNISVKAIRNLNTLSQGGLSAALSQGVYRFIDFYRYRKIGMTCSLHNDAFYLRGTARTASDQYLIDGGLLPPRIDVIISSPAISFKEMMRRLKRIERTDH